MTPEEERHADEKEIQRLCAKLGRDKCALEFVLAFQKRVVDNLKQDYLRHYNIFKKLEQEYEALDRELAKYDGRHVQCEEPGTVIKKQRATKAKEMLGALTDHQKKLLIAALTSGD